MEYRVQINTTKGTAFYKAKNRGQALLIARTVMLNRGGVAQIITLKSVAIEINRYQVRSGKLVKIGLPLYAVLAACYK